MVSHPLDPLSAAELEIAVAIYRRERDNPDGLVVSVALGEPAKDELAAWDAAGTPVERRAEVVIVAGPNELDEAVVSLTGDALLSARTLTGARPYMLFDEIVSSAEALKSDHRWVEALAKRGVTDLDAVQMDPWPPGTFGHPFETDRRLTKVIAYVRHFPEDNGYAHPIENLAGFVDLASREVLHVEDGEVVPVPAECANYFPDHLPDGVGPLRDDLKPIEITQPEGTSFTVEGNLVRWQRWQVRVSMHPVEGLVLHQLGYEDPYAEEPGRLRPIIHRASIAEMVVPYGSTNPAQSWKNAFDVGEWGLGRFVNSLELGCDCLGVIHYFDTDVIDEWGNTRTVPNVICLHEEDFSILWKHQDLHAFTTEVRRQRRLVISAISTIGNYEYGFYWYLYLDGTIELQVKLTGIIQPQAVSADGHDLGNANLVGPGLAAPHHQHLFCARLDLDVDGTDNTVVEVNADPMPPGPDNPLGNGFVATATPLRTEHEAQRVVDPARSRTWRIVNPSVTNRLGQPVSYKLIPGPTPTLYAGPESAVHQRATFATKNLWVTPNAADERRPAGDYPSQSSGGDGLPAWTAGDRPVENTDLVVWYSFGVTHLVRPEDFPVMPVEMCGFQLVPFGFFDRNPALDVPSSTGGHCHTD